MGKKNNRGIIPKYGVPIEPKYNVDKINIDFTKIDDKSYTYTTDNTEEPHVVMYGTGIDPNIPYDPDTQPTDYSGILTTTKLIYGQNEQIDKWDFLKKLLKILSDEFGDINFTTLTDIMSLVDSLYDEGDD